jgi:hypothetical protein
MDFKRYSLMIRKIGKLLFPLRDMGDIGEGTGLRIILEKVLETQRFRAKSWKGT